jgi:hypothetical protein
MKVKIDTQLINNTDCRIKCPHPYVLQKLREHVEASPLAELTKSKQKAFWFTTKSRADSIQVIDELVTVSKTAVDEAPYYQPWYWRYFWIFWAILWGVWDFGHEIWCMHQGDFRGMCMWGIVGVLIVLMSLKNHWDNKKRIQMLNEQIRENNLKRTENGNESKPSA